jgi:hypothetical protein
MQDNKVPVSDRLQGFGGIGHGPSKPKSYRATMDHNLGAFNQCMFGAGGKSSTAEK